LQRVGCREALLQNTCVVILLVSDSDLSKRMTCIDPQRDPLGFVAGDLNLYAYTWNESGLAPVSWRAFPGPSPRDVPLAVSINRFIRIPKAESKNQLLSTLN